jgi:hypothetical protein
VCIVHSSSCLCTGRAQSNCWRQTTRQDDDERIQSPTVTQYEVTNTVWMPLYFRTWLMRARCKVVNKSVLHTCPMKLLSLDGSKGVCHFLLRAKVTQKPWHIFHRRFHHPSVARFPSRMKSSSKILLLMPTSIWNTSKLCCSIRPVAVGWLN